jgi:hypothetical protein
MVFLSVNTPTKTDTQGHTIVVEKSTLSLRTAEGETSSGRRSFAVLSNPEFLVEATPRRWSRTVDLVGRASSDDV